MTWNAIASNAAAVNSWIRICNAADDPFHLGSNQCIAARRSSFTASTVATWFQINVDSRASCAIAGFFKSQHFGVFDSFIPMKAAANNDAILYDKGAYQWVRLYLTFTFGRERKREIKKVQIMISGARCLTQLK